MMDYRQFGKTDIKISEIGIGTWELSSDKNKNISSIRFAVEHGVNFLDTAEMYGTEQLLGEAIRPYDRNNLFVASKVWPDHFHHDDVIKSCNESLKKIGTGYLDLYQLHWPNPAIPIGETLSAMEELVDSGKIRHIGISNFSVKESKEAIESMKKYSIDSNQVEYSPVTRDIERDGIYDYCMKNNISIIAYSPLSHGKIFKNSALMKDLEDIAKKYDASPAQAALSWLLSKHVFPIPKAGDIKHMEENINAVNIKLNATDTDFISSLEKKYYEDSIASRFKSK